MAGPTLSSGSSPDGNIPTDRGLAPVDPNSPEDPKHTAARYLLEIEQAEKDAQRYLRRARKIVKIYTEQIRDETRTERQYAMLWANTEVLKPAVYARAPKPVVSRRFNDPDPVGRAASEVLQRSLVSTFERSNIDITMREVRDDFLLVARGCAWVRYEPTFETKEFNVGPDDSETVDVISDESLAYDFVNWADLIYPRSRTWAEVPWVARRVYLDKQAFIDRFGEELYKECAVKEANGVTPRLDSKQNIPRDKTAVYELWSKRDNCVAWLTKNCQKFLDYQPPLYDLHGFYPCPEPAFGTRSTDNLTPIPDYVFYQDQAEEINTLTAKIGGLQDALKLTGFYPAGAEGDISTAIERAAAPSSSNQMIPVPAWSQFQAGGGSKSMIEWWPADMVAKVLQACVELRRQLIDDVYQITGISDILRGASAPSETATAQNLKAQWGGIRIRDKQTEIARYARDLARISAEIISEKFQPDTIWRMTGLKYPTAQEKQAAQLQVQQMQQQVAAQPQPPQPGQPPQAQPPQQAAPELPPELEQILKAPTQEDVLQLIRDDQTRSYRIDIETDSTIAADEQAEQESRTKFAEVVGTLLQQSVPIIQTAPELADAIGETIMFVARAFRSGRQLEEAYEQAVQKIEQKAAKISKAPPQPNPEVITAQTEAEAKKADLQLRAKQLEADTAERAKRLQLDQQKLVQDGQDKQRSHALAAAQHNNTIVPGAADTMLQQILTQGFQALLTEQRSAALEQGQQIANQGQQITALTQTMAQILAVIQSPKRIVRGTDGRAIGVEPVRTLN